MATHTVTEKRGKHVSETLENETIFRALSRTPSVPEIDSASPNTNPTLSGLPLFLVIFSLCLVQFLSALDITIVATALPTIASQLQVDSGSYTWVGSAYNLASTASTPLWAKCSDIWGRKPILLMANAAFMAGSLVAGLASTGGMLIAGRTVQGLGGGGIVIMISIIIADLFPVRDRAKYYGMSSIVWAVASALGPVLGGVFTQTIGWRWCFFINLPFDAISIVLLWFVLRIQTPKTGLMEGLKTFDWIGSAAIVGGTILFLCGLEGGASGFHGWTSAYTLCLLIFGVAMIVVFVLYELYLARHPIIPMRVFVGRVNVASLTAATFHSFLFISYDYFLPLYYQVVLLATPIMSGVYLFALVVPLSLMSAATGFYMKKTGNYHYATWFGSTVMTIGTGLLIDLNTQFQLWKIIIYPFIAGIGAGPLFISPLIALQSHLRNEDVSAGTSAFTFLRSIASSISIVIGGVILQQGLDGNSLTDIGSNEQSTKVAGASGQENQRYVSALRNMWAFYTAIGGLVIISSLMITRHKSQESPRGDTENDSGRDDQISDAEKD